MSGSQRSGRLLIDGALRPGRVAFEGGRITAVELSSGPAPGDDTPLIAPGLVDLHVHGHGGCDPYDDLAGMARSLAAAGTTAFLPTLFPRRSAAELGAECAAVWARAQGLASDTGCAQPLGLHLEGPFVNPAAVGGLPADQLAEPSPAALAEILGPASGDRRGIRAMTLAPELPGALDLVAELERCGVHASLGHSRATAAEARAGLAAGARGATHLFNAMPPLHHREVGLAGVALTADGLAPEIIGDLVHVGRDAFQLALEARGTDQLCLVSDALKGPGDGGHAFCSHGKACLVEGGSVWFEDPSAPEGRRLTGTVLAQLDAVRRLVAAGLATPAEALTLAGATPARTLGLEHELGSLRPGARADLLVLDPEGLGLIEVLVGGLPLPQGP